MNLKSRYLNLVNEVAKLVKGKEHSINLRKDWATSPNIALISIIDNNYLRFKEGENGELIGETATTLLIDTMKGLKNVSEVGHDAFISEWVNRLV